MRGLLPPVVLGCFAMLNAARGSIHAFATDGGAHSIAGLDLSANAQTILSLFAVVGLHQIVMAGFQIFVLTFRRDLIIIALTLQTAETAFAVANLYFYRTLPVVVPGRAFNTGLLVVLVMTLVVARFGRRSASRS